MLRLVEAAVAAKIDLLQIREKQLSAKVLYELAANAARLTQGSDTKLLINDRADIAATTGADGVHLTTASLPANVARQAFGDKLLIGASTHSLEEALSARKGGADFLVYGPVFKTKSKSEYREPVGVAGLAQVCAALAPLPVLALGGISIETVQDCLAVGARGVAAIQMLSDPKRLVEIVTTLRLLEAGGRAGASPPSRP